MIALVGALCVSLYGSALAASTTKHRVDVTAKVKATKKSGTGACSSAGLRECRQRDRAPAAVPPRSLLARIGIQRAVPSPTGSSQR